jgi:hypothetical protein
MQIFPQTKVRVKIQSKYMQSLVSLDDDAHSGVMSQIFQS